MISSLTFWTSPSFGWAVAITCWDAPGDGGGAEASAADGLGGTGLANDPPVTLPALVGVVPGDRLLRPVVLDLALDQFEAALTG
jgi:hypothetical protein